MGRRERPLDPAAGPLEEFAWGLRELRYRAGRPTLQQMKDTAFVSTAALSEAHGGKKLPTLAVTLAYVRACRGDEREWEDRWLRLNEQLTARRVRSERRRAGIEPLAGDDPASIGPFRLQGRLGSGSMGQVYLGSTPGRRLVAVKVIRAEFADDPLFRKRFGREVAAAQRVHGLYVAPLVDADPAAARPWLATAYIPGPTLRGAVSEHGPLPLESLVLLAAGIAEALEAIFTAGLIHRDLKPANVILAEDGPRVIDFGIAQAVDATQLTHSGGRMGTPGFIAPEQVLGLPIGPAADVFALGAVLAYAGSGQPPFGEGTAESVLYRLVHQPPDLDRVPPDLRDIVESCLDKDPQRRPAPAEIIQRCQASSEHVAAGTGWLPSPVAADVSHRVRSAEGLTPPQRQLRWRIGAGLAVVAALVAAFVVGLNVKNDPAGTLHLRRELVPENVDLTERGAVDWVHWGHLSSDTGRSEEFVGGRPVDEECYYDLHCTNRKRGVNMIGDYTTIGNAAPVRLRVRDAPAAFFWRDGHPITTASDVKSQDYVGLRGNGFRISLPADRTPRTFTLYFAIYQGRAKCAASLSDNSAAPTMDDSLTTLGVSNDGIYSTCTYTYQAGDNGQQLTVELTLAEDGGGGNVALLAATLR